MIVSIEHRGVLVADCTLDGERKRDGIFPAHPSGLQLSRNRWLLLIATRGLRQHDDDHSIVYQLRTDAPDGPLLREGFLQRACTDYDPFQDGSAYVCLLRHPMGFGVPKGALIDGTPAAHGNRFAALWCRSAAGVLDPATGRYAYDAALEGRTLEGVWCQLQLNDAEDDIDIVRGPEKLRQVGYEAGPAFCREEAAGYMIASLVPPVPFTDDGREWAVTMNTGAGILAAKFRYNPATGVYDWVETGPARTGSDSFVLSEPALARGDRAWIVGVRVRHLDPNRGPDWAGGRARDCGHTGWIRTDDPFRALPFPTIVEHPNRQAPMTVFRCADGVVRLFSGDFTNSPHRMRRDPLYCWDVNTDDFSVSRPQVVCDSVATGAFPDDPTLPRSTCFASLLPHAGGREQTVVHRLMCFRYLPGVEPRGTPITPELLARHGVHHARIRYVDDGPPTWRF